MHHCNFLHKFTVLHLIYVYGELTSFIILFSRISVIGNMNSKNVDELDQKHMLMEVFAIWKNLTFYNFYSSYLMYIYIYKNQNKAIPA